MYKEPLLPATKKKILIVKTSSLGDIIQSFAALSDLRRRFPKAEIDWAVEESFHSLVSAHPLIRKAISLDLKGMKKGWRRSSSWKKLFSSFRSLRRERYDWIFDLQGNCKSGVVTFFARGKKKVGFGIHSVREWPNILFTNVRFEIAKNINIRLQHIDLIRQFFNDPSYPTELEGVRFKIDFSEKEKLTQILRNPKLQRKFKIMVCPGSKWMTKQLSFDTLVHFLKLLEERLDASFLLVWGGEEERILCDQIASSFSSNSSVIDRLSIPTWQNLMNEMDLILAVDSSALHLCGTSSAPSFSVFGPTSPNIFKPIGHRHQAVQGSCPYGRTFKKQCPILRTCPTGACIRDLKAEQIFQNFENWFKHLHREDRS